VRLPTEVALFVDLSKVDHTTIPDFSLIVIISLRLAHFPSVDRPLKELARSRLSDVRFR
jgi:hypothetical protein